MKMFKIKEPDLTTDILLQKNEVFRVLKYIKNFAKFLLEDREQKSKHIKSICSETSLPPCPSTYEKMI